MEIKNQELSALAHELADELSRRGLSYSQALLLSKEYLPWAIGERPVVLMPGACRDEATS